MRRAHAFGGCGPNVVRAGEGEVRGIIEGDCRTAAPVVAVAAGTSSACKEHENRVAYPVERHRLLQLGFPARERTQRRR